MLLNNLTDEILIFIINNKLKLTTCAENKKIIDSCKYFRLLFESTWKCVEEKHYLKYKVC